MDDKIFNTLLNEIKRGGFPPKCGLTLTIEQWGKIVHYSSLFCHKIGSKKYLDYIQVWYLGILDE